MSSHNKVSDELDNMLCVYSSLRNMHDNSPTAWKLLIQDINSWHSRSLAKERIRGQIEELDLKKALEWIITSNSGLLTKQQGKDGVAVLLTGYGLNCVVEALAALHTKHLAKARLDEKQVIQALRETEVDSIVKIGQYEAILTDKLNDQLASLAGMEGE